MAQTRSFFVPDDPLVLKPTLWQRWPWLGWPAAVFLTTAILTYVSFPPVNAGEAAFAFAIPAVLWAYRQPTFRAFAWATVGGQVVAWTCLLGWLYHVSWAAVFLLGPFVGLLNSLWFLAVWWTLPRVRGHRALVRIFATLGLAGLWVACEWFRGWLFGGFPWLPLAASQWQRPAMLQVAAYTGAWGISFALVMFNLGSAAYAHRIFYEGAKGLRKRSPEFTVGLVLLMASVFPFLGDFFGQQRQKLARVSLVQPYIPQGEKWDASKAQEILRTIEKVTFDANDRGAPDAVIWPEAVTPWTVNRDPNVADWLNSVSHRIGKPLLLGSIFTEGHGPDERWYNGAFVVDAAKGVQEPAYAKRKLVPFGEYVPLRPVLGWLEKVAPIGGDFDRGQSAEPLQLPVGASKVPVGILICYEDIFPNLARESTKSGAELLAVLTNNGWFGEGGAAYQHATHSVLRAVENRRPLVRVGNGGWSGWIDEYGVIRATAVNEHGTVYFRGAETVNITRDVRWRGRFSFYGQNGDWFLIFCAALATAGYYLVVMLRPPPPRADGESAF